MHRTVALLALTSLLAALASLPVAGQATAEEGPQVLVLEDEAGDVASGVPGAPAPPRHEYLDLRALAVEEQATGFALHLTLAGPPPDPEPVLVGAVTHTIGFRYGGLDYEARVQHGVALAGSLDEGELRAAPADEVPQAVAALDVRRDGEVLTVLVPRTVLLDADGDPAFAGQQLTGFWARSAGGTANLASIGGTALPTGFSDRAPATGTSDVAVPVRFGVLNEGHVRLASADPLRGSNGEAATFRFQVEAHNDGPTQDVLQLAAVDAPAGWLPRVQSTLGLDANASSTFDVVVDVPFAHEHGGFATFTLEARSSNDAASVGRVLLGLLYVDPPQPAGHHDLLWFHSHRGLSPHDAFDSALGPASGAVSGYVNTLELDDLDAGADVPPDFGGVADGSTRVTVAWSLPLRPALALGLDVDLRRTGELDATIASALPLPAASLEASVYVVRGEELVVANATAILHGAATPAQDLGPASRTRFLVTLAGTPEGDYVPFEAGNDLWLQLRLSYERPDVLVGPATPMLVPGGSARLPLLEYTDRVSAATDESFLPEPGAEDAAPRRESPAPGMALLGLAALAAALVSRR